MLDDIPSLTAEIVDEAPLASSNVDMRFGLGTRTRRTFREVTFRLAGVCNTTADIVRDVGHVLLYQPDTAAAYIGANGDA